MSGVTVAPQVEEPEMPDEPYLADALRPEPGQEDYVRAGFWGKVRQTLGRVPFLEQAIAAWYAAFDPGTPKRAKLMLLAALAYFVMPVDVIPDFVLLLGFTDDAAVLLLALRTLSGQIKPEHVARARAFLDADENRREAAAAAG